MACARYCYKSCQTAYSAGGRGFTAIIVAWLAKFNTFTMILISALIVFLDKGASQIASKYQINEYVSQIITGIILFFLLGSEFFINYNVKFRHEKAKEAGSAAAPAEITETTGPAASSEDKKDN